jgi:hypothetical protein
MGHVKITAVNDSNANLTLSEDGNTIGQATLSVDALDDLIAQLGDVRATLAKGFSEEPDPEAHEIVADDPAWRTAVSDDSDLDGVFLMLCHSAFGWLTFLLPHEEAAALGEWLSSNAKRQGPTG